MKKKKEIITNVFANQKSQLDEIRKESFKQGFWKGEEKDKQETKEKVLKLVDNKIKLSRKFGSIPRMVSVCNTLYCLKQEIEKL